jgi:hypothetical protein
VSPPPIPSQDVTQLKSQIATLEEELEQKSNKIKELENTITTLEAQLEQQKEGLPSMSEGLVFRCSMCGEVIHLDSSRYQDFYGEIVCPSCHAIHEVHIEGGRIKGVSLEPIYMDCPVCGTRYLMNYRNYMNYDGYWACSSCGTTCHLKIAEGKIVELTPRELTCPYCGKVITFECELAKDG